MPVPCHRLLLLTTLTLAAATGLLPRQASSAENQGSAEASYRGQPVPARDLTVLSPTLPPEALDRAVLNRLLQEISHDPETVMQRLQLDESSLADLRISIANAGIKRTYARHAM